MAEGIRGKTESGYSIYYMFIEVFDNEIDYIHQ